MRRYGLSTKREAVNFAIRMLVDNGLTVDGPRHVEPQQENVTYRRATIEEARRMRGETDLDRVPTRDEWLNRPLVPIKRPSREEFLAMRGVGWGGDLKEMRSNSPQLEAWLNRPDDEPLPNLEDESPRRADDTPTGGKQPQ